MAYSELQRDVADLFARRGNSEYGGEGVTQGEHGLQAAFLAETQHAPPAQIVAALLHDVGHLLHDLPDDAPDQGIDDRHEVIGCRWLENRFGPEVSEPVRLHVAAKRYLCTVDSSYARTLSPPSLLSLKLQGGLMTPDEVAEFESHPFYQESVDLRRWDDLAKDPELLTPDVAHYLQYIPAAVRACEAGRVSR